MRLFLFSIFILLSFLVVGQNKPNSEVKPINPYAEKPLKSNQFLYFDLEQIEFNYQEFKPLLNDNNIDLLEHPKLYWGLEYGVQYRQLFFSIQFSLGRKTQAINDSIEGRTNYNRFGLALGYYLVNSKKIQILPKFELFYNRIGLKNFSSDKNIPLEDYLENPNFDLNFSQFTGQIGLEVNWKIPNLSTNPTQPFLIGLNGGYNFVMGNTSLKSEDNTLTTSKNIGIESLSFGIHFTLYL